MDTLSFLLQSEYGIVSASISPAAGGCSTKAAYRVAGADGVEYFVKVYDKFLPTTRFFVERIDRYMPVLAWLSALPALRGRILTPVPVLSGAYKAETNGDVYAVFLFVRGEAPGIQGMTRAQTVELAEILALLHDTGNTVPFETPGLAEDMSLPFCDQLVRYLNRVGAKHGALHDLVSPHADMLSAAVRETLRLRDTSRLGYSQLVLCHGDAHGNNVIQSERLVLADWEDLRWAPAEADLFIHAWHPYGDLLLQAYASARRGYRINHDLLTFYTLRRRIEDVWFDIQRLTEESPNGAETAKLLDWTRRGIEEVRTLYCNGDSK
jgi:Ser/Thr protein kinase RdoA (MazF antagonist)